MATAKLVVTNVDIIVRPYVDHLTAVVELNGAIKLTGFKIRGKQIIFPAKGLTTKRDYVRDDILKAIKQSLKAFKS